MPKSANQIYDLEKDGQLPGFFFFFNTLLKKHILEFYTTDMSRINLFTTTFYFIVRNYIRLFVTW